MQTNEIDMTGMKWTEPAVKKQLKKLEKDALSSDALHLGATLVNQHVSRKSWNYWKKLFFNDEEIMEMMDRIQAIFENKLFAGAAKSELASAVAIFGLKNNHRWTDKPAPEEEKKKGEGLTIHLDHDTIIG